jgi:hypothetical protein
MDKLKKEESPYFVRCRVSQRVIVEYANLIGRYPPDDKRDDINWMEQQIREFEILPKN